KISRERELQADQVAVKLEGNKNLASALVKLHAFTSTWFNTNAFAREKLSEGKSVINMSELFGTVAKDNAKPEILIGLEEKATSHPTDTHPPLGIRLEALQKTLS